MSHWRDDLLGLFGEIAWQARRSAGAIGRAIDRDPIQPTERGALTQIYLGGVTFELVASHLQAGSIATAKGAR